MRIWFQKHVSIGKVPALDAGYEKHARQVVRPDTEVVFHGTPKETYEGSFPDRFAEHSFTETMCDEIASVWQHVRFCADVRCVILTGAGSKAFCTGR